MPGVGKAGSESESEGESKFGKGKTGVLINTNRLDVWEGESPTAYTVVLTSKPSGTVLINILNPGKDELRVGTKNLIFTASDWDRPQNVSCTGLNDNVHEGIEKVPLLHSIREESSVEDYHGAPFVAGNFVDVYVHDRRVAPSPARVPSPAPSPARASYLLSVFVVLHHVKEMGAALLVEIQCLDPRLCVVGLDRLLDEAEGLRLVVHRRALCRSHSRELPTL